MKDLLRRFGVRCETQSLSGVAVLEEKGTGRPYDATDAGYDRTLGNSGTASIPDRS
jgi:hypothetical protein